MEVHVRPWKRSDQESLVKAANNPSVSRFLRDRFPYPYTDADARKWLDVACGPDSPTYAIALKRSSDRDFDQGSDLGSDEAIGGIGVMPQEDIYAHSAELGYWLAEAYWNRGFMSAALTEFLESGVVKGRFVRVFAHVMVENVASARVLQKAGFELEGRRRKSSFKHGVFHDDFLYAKIFDR
mmetsp:Transcript_19501/g.33483  ORF Transcript_19501/g.33483 Transcript_19501/m.33483 type:complete len:182 (+) Transcript_19501:37-582(+)|eukprot:CAMPEP_0196654828 /NCGR_PEP_ID=MMETSP1086-20130531/4558_1 /TAXON_ID=77921 /ORGANISM="Cyanoptyche  gloeocystis , Strain SAG4.97" /LENGTH=181 /DNA_ID=CAMNT_0041986809 /DNA_START=18 /DNA_END=563 /DNA_ORIENTATION=-